MGPNASFAINTNGSASISTSEREIGMGIEDEAVGAVEEVGLLKKLDNNE